MERIAIVGCGDAGKSSLARRLGDLRGLPVIHLDRHFWTPGWVPLPRAAWHRVHRDLLAGDRWIADGNYGGTMDHRFEHADTILFLDLPRRVCLRRVLYRRWQFRGRSRPAVAEGCQERLSWEFVVWVLAFRGRARRDILRRIEQSGADTRVVVLRDAREIDAFVDGL